MLSDILKKRFKAGETLYGTFIDSCCEDLIEIVGLAGFDFAVVDSEHSTADPATGLRLLRAAETRNLPTLIRVPNDLPSTILKVMDFGSAGVMVPLVHTAAQAQAVTDSVKYYPRGRRGTAMMRGADYCFIDNEEYFSRTNNNAFVMVQAESMESIANLKAISETKELDSVFIGPYDLSQSMGIPGQVNDPRMLTVIESAAKTIRAAGKVAGIFAGSVENAKRFANWGYQLITYSADLNIFGAAARELAAKLKKS